MANVQILISEDVHRAVKAAAALNGETIREYADRVLANALPSHFFLPDAVKTFTETGKAVTGEGSR